MIFEGKGEKIVTKLGISLMALSIGLNVLSNFCNINNTVNAASRVEGIDKFPSSYQQALKDLQAKHPNWTFTKLDTGLDWNTVVSNQMVANRNLVSSNGSWVQASQAQVINRLDPRNYLNEIQIFQFETLSYNDKIHTQSGVEDLIYATAMSSVYKKDIKYYDRDGLTELTINKTYAQVINEAGKESGVSPYHLASRIIQENMGWNSPFRDNESINGKYDHPEYFGSTNLKGLYNYYNIQASGNHPIGNGLVYGLGLQSNGSYLTSYDRPWTDPEKSIKGGAKFIAKEYISNGQDTLYLEKFDVDNSDNSLYWHQYQQNVDAPYNEAVRVYKAYSQLKNFKDMALNFIIPVYNNMPGSEETTPNFTPDNTRVYLSATTLDPNNPNDYDYINLKAEPYKGTATLKTVNIYQVDKNNKDSQLLITRTGIGDGEYDRVIVKNLRENYEMEGYIYKAYIYPLDYTKVESVSIDKQNLTLQLGSTTKLNAVVKPDNAWFKNVSWSSNNDVVVIDANGNVRANKVGEATITVKTEDGSKTATTKIKVTASVTGITLPKEKYTIVKDSYLTITPTILPEQASNKDYTIKSENESIVKVENKKLKAVGVGTTKVTFTTVDGLKNAVATVTVINENDSNIIEFNDKIKVDETTNIITKIDFGTKVSDIKKNITTKMKLEFKNSANETLADDKIVGTGSYINVIDPQTSDILYVYTIIIYGDVDGSGTLDSMDMYKIVQHLLGNTLLKNPYLTAANTSRDTANVIDSMDMYKIVQHLLGNTKIEQ